jgi:hypothetical protein
MPLQILQVMGFLEAFAIGSGKGFSDPNQKHNTVKSKIKQIRS